jgi:hypothetical protein
VGHLDRATVQALTKSFATNTYVESLAGLALRIRLASAVAVVAALDLALFGVEFGINRWLSPRAAVPGP